jgi:hypothetical protein
MKQYGGLALRNPEKYNDITDDKQKYEKALYDMIDKATNIKCISYTSLEGFVFTIKVNEADGSSWYSWIESVNALPLNVNIYPNPTANKINIVFNANEAGSKVLNLIDIQGKKMLTKSIATQLGNNMISIDISSFSNGTYLLTGLTENGNIIIKQ